MNSAMTYKIFRGGLQQIFRDGILLILIPAPFLMGAVLRFFLPFADILLQQRMDYSIAQWFPLSDGMLVTMTPIMTAMICAFLILDEKDENIGIYYRITPAAGYSYLAARILLPMLWAFGASILVMSLFSLAVQNPLSILVASFVGSMQGMVMSMLLVSIAGNKVEGLALAKLTNIFAMGFLIPFFMEAPTKYLFGILPSLWLGEVVKGTHQGGAALLLYGLMGALTSLFWMGLLSKIFLRRI
ncbi:MAG: hypothetical protein D5S00_05520 [Tindallia sp. MSAO_Bac2]|nr:MAG: hypothetical protein D5S00_05520 [Tindallia sp. MSAO_Bac2]